jgi:hypothetical protein
MALYQIPNSLRQAEMTKAILSLPNSFNHIQKLSIFTNIHVTSRDVAFEFGNGQLSFVPASMPCGDGHSINNNIGNEDDEVFYIRAPHHEVLEEVNICMIAGFRQWNSDAWETVQHLLSQRLILARQSFDYTIEVLQLNALLGQYCNEKGKFIDLSSKFNNAPSTDSDSLPKNANVEDLLHKITQKMAKVLKKTGKRATQWLVLASDGWYNKLNAMDYFNKQGGNCCAGADAITDAFGVSRKINNFTIVNFNGEGLANIPANQAVFIPLGVPDMLVTYWTPAMTMQTINRISPKITVQTELMKFQQGLQAIVHMDPLTVNKIPEAVLIHTAT